MSDPVLTPFECVERSAHLFVANLLVSMSLHQLIDRHRMLSELVESCPDPKDPTVEAVLQEYEVECRNIDQALIRAGDLLTQAVGLEW
jgi:hypothetical protein